MLDFQGHQFQELLRAGQPVYATNKLRFVISELKLSCQTSFDVNLASLPFLWNGSFWNMKFKTISLPFKTVRTASSNDESDLSKGLKASQVVYAIQKRNWYMNVNTIIIMHNCSSQIYSSIGLNFIMHIPEIPKR